MTGISKELNDGVGITSTCIDQHKLASSLKRRTWWNCCEFLCYMATGYCFWFGSDDFWIEFFTKRWVASTSWIGLFGGASLIFSYNHLNYLSIPPFYLQTNNLWEKVILLVNKATWTRAYELEFSGVFVIIMNTFPVQFSIFWFIYFWYLFFIFSFYSWTVFGTVSF